MPQGEYFIAIERRRGLEDAGQTVALLVIQYSTPVSFQRVQDPQSPSNRLLQVAVQVGPGEGQQVVPTLGAAPLLRLLAQAADSRIGPLRCVRYRPHV